MAGNQELLQAFDSFTRAVEGFTTGLAIRQGQRRLDELNAMELSDEDRRKAQIALSRDVASRVALTSGGNAQAIQNAAALFAPPKLDELELTLAAEQFQQSGLEEAGDPERLAARERRLRTEKRQDEAVKALIKANTKQQEGITKDKDVVFENLRDTTKFLSSLRDFESFTDKLEVDPTGFFKVPRQASVDRFAASVLGEKGLTEFIKSTSGAQVTDKEREFLQRVFPSLQQGALTRGQLKTSLNIFRKGAILGLAQDIEVAETRGANQKQVRLLQERIQKLAAPLGLQAKTASEIIDELNANDLTEGLGGARAPAGGAPAPEQQRAFEGLRSLFKPVKR